MFHVNLQVYMYCNPVTSFNESTLFQFVQVGKFLGKISHLPYVPWWNPEDDWEHWSIRWPSGFFFWLALPVGNEGPSTFTLVYWGFIPSFPTKGQRVFAFSGPKEIHKLMQPWFGPQGSSRKNGRGGWWVVSVEIGWYVPGSKLPLFPYNRGWSSTQ